MIRSYFKIAWRNLLRHKLYSFINLFGLAAGLAVCMMIMLYVAHEMSYDRFHKNAGRIFGVHYLSKNGDNTLDWVKYDSGPSIKQSQPVVEAYMRTLDYDQPVIVSNPLSPAEKFSEKGLLFADSNFFNFFSFKLLSGQAEHVLENPFTVVISKDMAMKYFGKHDPVGKTITLKTDSAYTYQVTGVAENNPSNSSISYDFVASGSSLRMMKEYQGRGIGSNTFLLLKHAADSSTLRRSIQSVLQKEGDTRFTLVPLPDRHLKNVFSYRSKVDYLKIFSLVAVLILLLALVNYMSLSTARATLRAKEIGVRIVSGADRKNIAAQFYTESALFVFLSFILGYLICYALKPGFLNVLQLKIDNSFLYSLHVLILLSALFLVTVLMAGSYPAFVLSSFRPAVTLKGKMSKKAGGIVVRKVFTLLQFAISVGLIICGIVMDRQLYFFRHADTGIDRENVMMIHVANSLGKNYPAFNHDVRSLSGVSRVAASRRSVFEGNTIYMIDDKTSNEVVYLRGLDVDDHFIQALDLKWKTKPGPNAIITGKDKILINEAAVGKLHLNPDPTGTFIGSGDLKYEIAGVLKNFNYESMANAVEPLAVAVIPDTSFAWNKDGSNLYVKIRSHTNLPALINSIENIYMRYDQETPFSYSFMDDDFNKQYKAEDRLASIFSLFTCLAILLSVLGLFGLAAFTVEQRTKEIGIRKVLGATITQVSALLSKSFLRLTAVAIIIASPVAWWAMNSWLQNFAYRIEISWWMFASAALLMVSVVFLTVSFQAVKAGLANPVKSLRSE